MLWKTTSQPKSPAAVSHPNSGLDYPSSMRIKLLEVTLSDVPGMTCQMKIHVRGTGGTNADAVISSKPLFPATTLTWPGNALTPSELTLRASSHLDIVLFDIKNGVVSESTISWAEIITGASIVDQDLCICRVSFLHKSPKLGASAEMRVKVIVLTSPRIELYKNIPDPCVREAFSNKHSQHAAALLKNYLVIQSLYTDRLPPLMKRFTASTLSVFWRVTEKLGKAHVSTALRSDRSVAIESIGQLPDTNPLQDIISQMNDLQISLMQRTLTIHPQNQSLLEAVFAQLCLCAAELEYAIECYRDWTWASAVANNKKELYSERQSQLFILRCKTCILLHKGITPHEVLTECEAVEQLLIYSIGEHPQENDRMESNPLTPQERVKRPCTAALASPRGRASETVWGHLYQQFQRSHDPDYRDAARRAMLRLIQASDRIPAALRVTVEAVTALCAGGAFAKVYRGKANGKRDAAIKVPQVLLTCLDDIKARKEVYLEIITWKTLNHPRILPFWGVQNLEMIGPICLVSQFMTRGTLRQLCNATTSSALRLSYMKEIVEGMVYLHREGIVHGDLRAANIFIDDDGHIRIGDFGLCVFAEGFSQNYFSMRSGNVQWIAPEILEPLKYGRSVHEVDIQPVPGTTATARPTKEGDVYTFACLCIELYTGDVPFPCRDEHWVRAEVPAPRMRRPTRPNNMADPVWELMRDMWHNNKAKRPNFSTILQKLESYY